MPHLGGKTSAMKSFGAIESGVSLRGNLLKIMMYFSFIRSLTSGPSMFSTLRCRRVRRKDGRERSNRQFSLDGVRQAQTTKGESRSPCPDWWEISIITSLYREGANRISDAEAFEAAAESHQCIEQSWRCGAGPVLRVRNCLRSCGDGKTGSG